MSLDLEIRTPEDLVLRRDVISLQAGDATGRFGLRPGHEAFVTVLEPGIVTFRDADGGEGFAAVDGGVLLVEADHVSIVAREAVVADSLQSIAAAAAARVGARRGEEESARLAAEQIALRLLEQLRELGSRP